MNQILDFMIIGAQKSGTTTLFDFLSKHPDICVPDTKETRFFTKDEFYKKGENYLKHLLKNKSKISIGGCAYAHQLFFTEFAERVYKQNNKIKLICILRNPIDRAYSAYWFAKRNIWENSSTFEEALEKENLRIKGNYLEFAELTYLNHGHYYQQLQEYLKIFDKEQFFILLTEDLKNEPKKTYSSLLEFLGVNSKEELLNFNDESNQSGWPRFPFLQRVLVSVDSWYKRSFRKVTTAEFRYFVRKNFLKPVIRFNVQPFKYPPMREDTRSRLREYFRDHNRRLSDLIGRDLSHWQ